MPTATIFEPLTGDTATAPVVVQAGYNTAANFKLTCLVGTTPGTEGNHPPTSGLHGSGNISPATTTHTIYAKDTTAAPVTLDSQPGVVVTSGVPPVTIETVGPPTPSPGDGVKRNKVKKKRKVDGVCDPGLSPPAAYVICR